MGVSLTIVLFLIILSTFFIFTNSCVCEYYCDRCSYDCRRCYFCYPGYFTQFGHCVPCDEGCDGCDGASGSCTNCKTGYHWTKGYCEKDDSDKDKTDSSTLSTEAIIFIIIGGILLIGAVFGVVLFIMRRNKSNRPENTEKLVI